jgi:hypothetical protein
VAVQAPAEIASDGPALEISARFVQYRGLDESAVRQRVGLLPLTSERLKIGECAASEPLWADEEPAAREPAVSREVSLIDVGNIAVQIGEASVDVPLSLVPDLLPYMSGVEYDLVSEVLPARAWPSGEPSPTAVTITVDGAGDDELPASACAPRSPRPWSCRRPPTPGPRLLLLEWRPDGRGAPLVLRLSVVHRQRAGRRRGRVSGVRHRQPPRRPRRPARRRLDLSGDTLRVGASRIARARRLRRRRAVHPRHRRGRRRPSAAGPSSSMLTGETWPLVTAWPAPGPMDPAAARQVRQSQAGDALRGDHRLDRGAAAASPRTHPPFTSTSAASGREL